MSKRYLSIVSFAILLCAVFLIAVSCKKDDIENGETPEPTEADYFIDVDFLPKTETNGEVAPRMIINFNNEMLLLELRPSADTILETMLFLCPNNEAMLVCGNENLMICADFDMETYSASNDVLLVTQMDDNTLLLTQCLMDWNTNTMTTGDMMALPIDDNSKSYRNKGSKEDDWRIFFINRFMRPLVNRIEKMESITGSIGLVPAAKMFTIFKYVLTTEMPIILFSDDPELLIDCMEYPFVTGTAQGAQNILLRFAPKGVREMASSLVSLIGLFTSDGYGNINGHEEPPMSTFFAPASKLTYAAAEIGVLDPIFIINLNVSNITESSAYLKGSIDYGINHITPIEMGYVFRVNGGPEQTVADLNFYGKTISGLHKATKYTVYAYARSLMEGMVVSPTITFYTLGFDAFPNSLTFPAEGGTKNVALSFSHEDISSWDITSKPSWCTTTIDDLGLFAVTVDATTETRSGTITITAHSNALGNVTTNITITQNGIGNWDGTSWIFSGTLTINGIAGNSSIPIENSTLVVNSVANNNIEFDLSQTLAPAFSDYHETYYIDGNGNLIYSSTSSLGYEGNLDCRVTFTRTGSTTATADIYMKETFPGGISQSFSGLLNGTLNNAKGNYED